MATTNNITPPPTETAEPTEAERFAKQVVSDADLALNRLANSIQTGFQLVWGTKEQPKETVIVKDNIERKVKPLNENQDGKSKERTPV